MSLPFLVACKGDQVIPKQRGVGRNSWRQDQIWAFFDFGQSVIPTVIARKWVIIIVVTKTLFDEDINT